MGIVILIVFGAIMALFAGRKGYNPALWFLAAGILGLLILAFLPYVNEKSNLLPEEMRASKKKTGDIIGGVISGVAVVIILIGLAAQ